MEKRCVQAPAAVPSVRMLALAGALAALSCAATLTVAVPTPTGGYVNPGDAVVLLGAYVLGGGWGAAAGALGPALADLLGGYGIYAPATLVIKGLMALAAGKLYRRARGRSGQWRCAARRRSASWWPATGSMTHCFWGAWQQERPGYRAI